MRVAVMQPYFYPYQGYFDLIKQVDLFVILSDVQYVKRRWINRNVLADGKWFTMPVSKCSQKTLICDVKILDYPVWHPNLVNHIKKCYGNKPLDHPVYQDFLRLPIKKELNLSAVLDYSIRSVCNYFKISTSIIDSREINVGNRTGQERIIEICRQLKATEYFNMPGGRKLYDHFSFDRMGISLNFMNFSDDMSNYSILDNCFNG